MSRRMSPEARARRKVARAAARSPLFAHAGILGQVADVAYDARRILDEDFARALGRDEARLRWEAGCRRRLAAYRAMLAEVAGPEEAEAIEAGYLEHWRGHGPMLSLAARCDHLCRQIAQIAGRTPVSVHEEATSRE